MYRPTPDCPKVFISYSHDSPAHLTMVLELCNRLRADGIDSYIDQYEMSPSEGWARWTMRKVEEADFVLVVCTETYSQRFSGKEEKGKGRGVKWEGAVITQELYEHEAKNKKFIPVLFSASDSAHVPISLRGATFYDLSTEEGYEELYRRLTNQPRILMAGLGQRKPMPPAECRQSFPIIGQAPDQSSAMSRSAVTDEASASIAVQTNDSPAKLKSRKAAVWAVGLLLFISVAALGWWLSQSASVARNQPASALRSEMALRGKPLRTLSEIYDIALSQDGAIAASAEANGDVRLWNVAQAVSLMTLKHASDSQSARCVAISPDGKTVASGGDDGKIRLWQISDGRSLGLLKSHTDYVFQIYFSADGQKIISAGIDDGDIRSVRLLNVSDGSFIRELPVPGSNGNIITISPNQEIIVFYIYETKKVQLWSLSRKTQLSDLEGPGIVVRGGAFSPDGKTLALGSEDGTIRLWEVKDGKKLNELKGRNDNVEAIAFHPNGQIIAAGYPDGTICLWNVNEANPFSVQKEHNDRVNVITFSANDMLASGSKDGAIQLWRIASSD